MTRHGYQVIPPTPDSAEENIFEKLTKTRGEVILTFERLLASREVLVKVLKKIQEEVEKSYDDSRKAKVAGSVVSIVGAATSIVGFILIPFTLGGSITLAVGGGVAAAAGGLTTAGAEIGYYAVSKTKLEDARTALKIDEEEREKLLECGEKYDKLVEVFSETPEEKLSTQLKNFIKKKGDAPTIVLATGRGAYYSFKIVDSGFDTAKIIRSAVGTARAIKAGTQTSWAVLRTGFSTLKILGVAADIASIPLDALVLAKASYDIHKFRTTGESNSYRATEVKGYIDKLEENEKEIKKELARLKSPQNPGH